MSQILSGLVDKADSRPSVLDSALDAMLSGYFDRGLSFENGTLAVDSAGAASHYNQGLPFTVNNRVAISLEQPVARVGNGAAPFDANGRLACSNVGAVDRIEFGVPYTAAGQIAVNTA